MSSLASLQRIKQADAALAASSSDYYNHPDFAQLRHAIAEAIEATAPKLVKPKAPGALEFWRAHGQAVDAIVAVYGAGWKYKAPIGETVLASVTSGLRSYKTERGTTLKWARDHRMPAAQYWLDGVLPIGVEVSPDHARDTSATTYGPSGHGTEWHVAHGYVRNDAGMWVDELDLRASRSHVEAIEKARVYRKARALESAALSYGPQPAETEMRAAA